ncbi:MAG: PEP-CTERM sorting domain-containing protein [Phycisphaerae bacterium]|nr:PEP-CTERM sorting domain-containing protein [Phycisphaerae bacterium]
MKAALVAATAAILLFASVGSAEVLYDFESGSQGWGAYGTPTTDSGVIPEGSVGQGRFHTADFAQGGWGIIDVSPAGIDLSAYTGLSVDARWRDIDGYTPITGVAELDFGIEAAGVEYYAPAVTLTSEYQTLSIDFAAIAPGVDLSSSIIKLRILSAPTGGTGIGELDYDQVTGIPEPASIVLMSLGLLIAARRR